MACSGNDAAAPRGPWLEAEWTGTDTGRISAPATAEWCDSLGVLEIRAIRGDTGVALAIYSRSNPKAGRYPVRPPIRGDSVSEQAAVAARWFAETAIKGFRGDSGRVQLERSTTGVLSGRFDAHLSAVNATDRISIRGNYRDLEASPAARGCSQGPTGSAADTGVN